MLSYIEYLNMPTKVAFALVGVFLVIQIIGEVLEFMGKVVPEYAKVRKYFARKKKEKNEMSQALKEIRQLLDNVMTHYSEDNINKRNNWIQWVNDRAIVYDELINKVETINENLTDIVQELKSCTRMTEEMFVQNSRDRIIDFAAKVANADAVVSREEFNRIFKVYNKYEDFLEEHEMSNGEIDIAYRIINESYEQRIKHNNFIENARGYSI